MNRGFADLRVEPLHHVARWSSLAGYRRMLAAPRGFEPRFTDSKSAVLPLDEGAAVREANGAEDGTRTRDPHLGKVMLYQLSHFRPNDPSTRRWCREPGSNWRHRDFQSRALPTELSRPDGQPAVGCPSAGGTIPRASPGQQRRHLGRGRIRRRRCDQGSTTTGRNRPMSPPPATLAPGSRGSVSCNRLSRPSTRIWRLAVSVTAGPADRTTGSRLTALAARPASPAGLSDPIARPGSPTPARSGSPPRPPRAVPRRSTRAAG